MKTRNAEAQRLEGQYLAQLRVALAAHSSSEAAEILQGVRDHIDEALEETPGNEITAVPMGNVLERLGPPEAFAQEDDSSERTETAAAPQSPVAPPAAMASPRVSKLAVASALSLPVAGLAGVALAILVQLGSKETYKPQDLAAVAGFAFLTVMLAGLIMGITALSAIRHSSGKLRGNGLAILGIGEFGIVLLLLLIAFLG